MLGNVEAWTAWAGAGLVMVSSVLVAMNGKGSSGKGTDRPSVGVVANSIIG